MLATGAAKGPAGKRARRTAVAAAPPPPTPLRLLPSGAFASGPGRL